MTEKSETAIATSGLKVIGAGLARTGTMSLKIALEELGFGPCYHMTEVLKHPKHIRLWDAAARGETVNWRKIFKGYQATTDWPACIFYKELMKVYPDAKVLLTVRDPEKWFESVQSTLHQKPPSRTPSSFVNLLLTRFFPDTIQRALRMVKTLVWEGKFKGRFTDKQYAIEIFNQHIEEVKKYVPAERLLVYNVEEGWEPLCAFLEVEVPKDRPFPYLNKRRDFIKVVKKAKQRKNVINMRIVIIAIFIASIFFSILLLLRKIIIKRE